MCKLIAQFYAKLFNMYGFVHITFSIAAFHNCAIYGAVASFSFEISVREIKV